MGFKIDYAGNKVVSRCKPIKYPAHKAKGILWTCHGCETTVEAKRPPYLRPCSIGGFCLFDPANGNAGKRFRGMPGAMKEYSSGQA